MTLKDNNDGTFSIVAPCSFEKPTKEEALKLADELNQIDEVEYSDLMVIEKGIAMIRRLVEELDKQKYQNELLENSIKLAMLANAPNDYMKFAREIEERHGIK